jgi:hypothetical protein
VGRPIGGKQLALIGERRALGKSGIQPVKTAQQHKGQDANFSFHDFPSVGTTGLIKRKKPPAIGITAPGTGNQSGRNETSDSGGVISKNCQAVKSNL